MFNKTYLRNILIGISVIGIFYFLFFFESAPKKKKNLKSEDLSFLFSGVKSSNRDSQDDDKIGVDRTKSVFESDFFKSGKISYDEPDANENHPTPQGDIPVNPQTGKPYSEEAMEQFDSLREKFPNNDLIPKRLTPESKSEKAKQDDKLAKVTNAVMNKTANSSEIKDYYRFQEKSAKDRLEIIEYLVQSQKESGEEDEGGQFQKILDGIKLQYDQIKKEKESAYKNAGISD